MNSFEQIIFTDKLSESDSKKLSRNNFTISYRLTLPVSGREERSSVTLNEVTTEKTYRRLLTVQR